jgi:hypothetical protein
LFNLSGFCSDVPLRARESLEDPCGHLSRRQAESGAIF